MSLTKMIICGGDTLIIKLYGWLCLDDSYDWANNGTFTLVVAELSK